MEDGEKIKFLFFYGDILKTPQFKNQHIKIHIKNQHIRIKKYGGKVERETESPILFMAYSMRRLPCSFSRRAFPLAGSRKYSRERATIIIIVV